MFPDAQLEHIGVGSLRLMLQLIPVGGVFVRGERGCVQLSGEVMAHKEVTV